MIQFEQQQKENGQNKQIVLHADGDFLRFWGSETPSYHIAHSPSYPPRIVAVSEIAQQLIVSLNTLRTHTKNIYSKLGVNDRRTAIRRAEELDLF